MTPAQRRILMGSGGSNIAYVAVANSSSPYVTLYRRRGALLTKLSDPGALPTGQGNAVAADPTGIYLAVAHNTSPYFSVYKRSGDTFTKLANSGTLPVANGLSVAWIPGTLYLLVGIQNDNNSTVLMYQASGTTLIYVETLVTFAAPCQSISFNATGNAMLTGGNGGIENAAAIVNYSVSGTTLTEGTGVYAGYNVPALAFSPNNAYVAVGFTNPAANYFKFFSTPVSNATILSNPSVMPNARVNAIAWSPDSLYCAVGYAASPYILVYKNTAPKSFTPLVALANIPAGPVTGIAFTADNQYMIVTANDAVGVYVYLHNGDNFTLVTPAAVAIPAGIANGICAFGVTL